VRSSNEEDLAASFRARAVKPTKTHCAAAGPRFSSARRRPPLLHSRHVSSRAAIGSGRLGRTNYGDQPRVRYAAWRWVHEGTLDSVPRLAQLASAIMSDAVEPTQKNRDGRPGAGLSVARAHRQGAPSARSVRSLTSSSDVHGDFLPGGWRAGAPRESTALDNRVAPHCRPLGSANLGYSLAAFGRRITR